MLEPIIQQIDRDRADLVNQYHQALREALFTNCREVRPSILGRIASDEAEAVHTFFQHLDPAVALQRGEQLCRLGLSEESIFRLSQITRRFCLNHLQEDLRFLALETIEAYHSAIIQGFIHESKAVTLAEQERIRSALQRTLSRYAVQMEVAADVARAATSILDLNELLQTTAELIRERFDLYYVGIFLVDKDNRWAILQASAGEAGQVMLRRGYRLKVGGDSMVGWCVAHGEARIVLDVGEAAKSFDIALTADVHSEMSIPLISRGKVIGAIATQSPRIAAFSDQDVAIMHIIADQLANAIENARLYEQVRQELTERKRAVEELQIAKDAAETANRAKSTFLAIMSHELRTPLTAIMGFSELLQLQVKFLGYVDLVPDLEKIHTAGQHLLTLITDILDLSKIEANKMEVQVETFDIRALIHDVITTVQPLIEKNANILQVYCPSDLRAMHSDQTKVRQALYNLLSNAAKFTERGTVTLTVWKEETNGAAWIAFQVVDTGVGMTAEQMQQLFKEFTQVDTSTTRKYGGTGLGLALSQRFCQMMGGDISVESEIGRGSTFTIRLPATIADPSTASSS
jgi:signal transduction histidine kinase